MLWDKCCECFDGPGFGLVDDVLGCKDRILGMKFAREITCYYRVG